MHVLIATSGALSPDAVAEFTARLVPPDGIVTVVTVIEVPRSFLDTISSETWHPLDTGEQPAVIWGAKEDAVVARYVTERGRRVTAPVMTALTARGIEAQAHYLEGEDPAETIIKAVVDMDVDLVILGATRPIFDEAAWESVSARVMRDGQRPVLVLPPTRRLVSDDDYVREDHED